MSLLIRSPLVRIGLIAASLAAVAAAVMTSTGSLFVVAVLLLLPISTSLSQAEEGRVVIDDAAYVQWAGKRLARAEGFPAVAINWMVSGVT
ncbi:MAG: hypothetical protein ABUT39_23340 [Acidobacteriota bacterium]